MRGDVIRVSYMLGELLELVKGDRGFRFELIRVSFALCLVQSGSGKFMEKL